MKKSLFTGLLTSLLCIVFMSSCGGDEDELLTEDLVGDWEGTFVVASADSITATESSSLHFGYPYIVVRGKTGVGTEVDNGGEEVNFQWEVKYGKIYLRFEDADRDLVITYYDNPIGDCFKGLVDETKFELHKVQQ